MNVEAFRLLLYIAVKNGWEFSEMDIQATFSQTQEEGDLKPGTMEGINIGQRPWSP